MRILAILALVLALSPVARAKKGNAQQDRMKACNAQAAEKKLKGDARKAFLKECLAGEVVLEEKKLSPQQEKMKACNRQAGEKKLKGDARKAFMGACLKGA